MKKIIVIILLIMYSISYSQYQQLNNSSSVSDVYSDNNILLFPNPTTTTGSHTWKFVINNDTCQVVTPNNYNNNSRPSKFAIFCGGVGATYNYYAGGAWKDSLLANDFVVATMTSGNLWGNLNYQNKYQNLYEFVLKNFNVENSISLYGQSAGGLGALNLVINRKIPVKNIALIMSVVALDSMYLKSQYTSQIETAYGFSGYSNFSKYAGNYDPYSYNFIN